MWLLRRVVVCLILALGPAAAFAGDSLDALSQAPTRFRLLLENEHVRVLEYKLEPGEKDAWHTHPPKVSYVVTGGRLRIHLADGTHFDTDEAEGTAVWMNELPKHYAENIGKTAVKIVLIEVKVANPQ